MAKPAQIGQSIKLTPLAERLIEKAEAARADSFVDEDGDEIGSPAYRRKWMGAPEAARIAGVSRSTVGRWCDEGVTLVPGRDWKRDPSRVPGQGRLRIRRAALMAVITGRADRN